MIGVMEMSFNRKGTWVRRSGGESVGVIRATEDFRDSVYKWDADRFVRLETPACCLGVSDEWDLEDDDAVMDELRQRDGGE